MIDQDQIHEAFMALEKIAMSREPRTIYKLLRVKRRPTTSDTAFDLFKGDLFSPAVVRRAGILQRLKKADPGYTGKA